MVKVNLSKWNDEVYAFFFFFEKLLPASPHPLFFTFSFSLSLSPFLSHFNPYPPLPQHTSTGSNARHPPLPLLLFPSHNVSEILCPMKVSELQRDISTIRQRFFVICSPLFSVINSWWPVSSSLIPPLHPQTTPCLSLSCDSTWNWTC